MSEKPLCMMCGGTCFRLWDHFGEGEPPDWADEFDDEPECKPIVDKSDITQTASGVRGMPSQEEA